mmetsp:Transcript_19166/g.17377  ORF Transcript_19166/g.17377 Transcript_19166/m.17377 type:complete len:316 (-) Transcript_19166:104-1051(-)
MASFCKNNSMDLDWFLLDTENHIYEDLFDRTYLNNLNSISVTSSTATSRASSMPNSVVSSRRNSFSLQSEDTLDDIHFKPKIDKIPRTPKRKNECDYQSDGSSDAVHITNHRKQVLKIPDHFPSAILHSILSYPNEFSSAFNRGNNSAISNVVNTIMVSNVLFNVSDSMVTETRIGSHHVTKFFNTILEAFPDGVFKNGVMKLCQMKSNIAVFKFSMKFVGTQMHHELIRQLYPNISLTIEDYSKRLKVDAKERQALPNPYISHNVNMNRNFDEDTCHFAIMNLNVKNIFYVDLSSYKVVRYDSKYYLQSFTFPN